MSTESESKGFLKFPQVPLSDSIDYHVSADFG